MSWPLPAGLDDAALEDRLYPGPMRAYDVALRQPDWPQIHHELKRSKSVTLSLLWEEYRADHPVDGYGYSRFCELYKRWEGRLTPTMRHHHFAGERVLPSFKIETMLSISAMPNGSVC